jgi:hypothetical protein
MKSNLNTNPEYVKREADKDIGFSNPPDSTSYNAKGPRAERVEPWSCVHCTFRNELSAYICEMCSKTKDFVLESPVSFELAALPQETLSTSGEWTEVTKGRKKSKGSVGIESSKVRSYPSSSYQYPTRITMENETRRTPTASGYGSRNGSSEHELVQCTKCTLLNPVGRNNCEACEARLSFPEYNGTLT